MVGLFSVPTVLGTLTPKYVHLYSQPFLRFHLEEMLGMYVQIRCDISRTVEDRD